MSLSPPPNQQAVQDAQGKIAAPWQQFQTEVFRLLTALQSSGTTAQRPTKGLYVGRPYFDTTLNRPIWYTGTNWIRADGAVV